MYVPNASNLLDPADHDFALQLVFQMTVRMATCREFAQDIQAVDEVHRQFWILEKSATPTRLLLPWFPGPARRRNDAATKELYMTLYTVVEKRRAAETPSSDAIDLLIAEGFENGEIIQVLLFLCSFSKMNELNIRLQFILAVIFAGVVNTGLNGVSHCFLDIQVGSSSLYSLCSMLGLSFPRGAS